MKKLILLIITIFTSTLAFSQDFNFGEVDYQALDMQKYDKDTSAHAVVLNEHGICRIAATNSDEVRLEYSYHAKIKFFDDKEFERGGTIEIPVYSGDGQTYEEVTEIKGITYYKDENGHIQQVELDPKKVYKEKVNKHWTNIKFAMPALHKGCVIEVKYDLESPYIYDFHKWMFQGYIPKMYSEYEAHIPGFWTYNISLRGFLKLTKNNATLEKGCFSYGGSSADCTYLQYGIKDVPAFVEEDYMTAPKNYMSGVYFELMEEQDLRTGAKRKVSKEWKDLDYTLKDDYSVGGQLKRKELLKEHITPVITGLTDSLTKAKAVYSYIQKSFKWNEGETFFSTDGIKKALEAHTGSSGDINLALVTALNSAHIPAEAVLLSTRDHGAVNKLYPSIEDFNYVVARTTIGGKTYMLDATDPLLAFGMLPMRCLNDQGRVFSLDKPSYWIDMTTPQRETTTYAFNLTLQDNGKLKGTVTRYSTGYSAYLKRKEIKKFNSTDEYFEHLGEKLTKIKILDAKVSSLDSLDMPVTETFEVEMSAFDNLNHDKLSFNPIIFDRVTTNPFKLAERDYPVDWGMPSDERYIVTIHLPQQFTIENPPQTFAYTMPNSGGRFLTGFENDNNTFTFSYVTQFNKSVYSAEEYPYLKELFNKIILSEKNEMVFKKKS